MSKTEPPQLNGVLLIDKPPKLTSHDVVAQIRRLILNTKYQLPNTKVGHTGTLDPFATGLLVIATGPATRLIEYTHQWPKTYHATITLGASSTTDDLTGQLTKYSTESPKRAQIAEALANFLGNQQQLPPAYAAIKIKGRKLYEYARVGESPPVKSRAITIHRLTLRQYHYPQLTITISCSTGTYIRALARDIGQALETGAYLTTLRRLRIGPFDIQQAIQLDQINQNNLQKNLLPPNMLVSDLPTITLSDDNVAQLKKGQTVEWKRTTPSNQPLTLLHNQQLIGIGHLDSNTTLLYPDKILRTDDI